MKRRLELTSIQTLQSPGHAPLLIHYVTTQTHTPVNAPYRHREVGEEATPTHTLSHLTSNNAHAFNFRDTPPS